MSKLELLRSLHSHGAHLDENLLECCVRSEDEALTAKEADEANPRTMLRGAELSATLANEGKAASPTHLAVPSHLRNGCLFPDDGEHLAKEPVAVRRPRHVSQRREESGAKEELVDGIA